MGGQDTTVGPVPAPSAEDRLNRVWHGLFAAVLAVPTIIVLATGDGDGRERLVTVALVVGFAGWHWAWLVRHPQWWERLGPMAGYWAGAIVFTVALVGIDNSFTILLYGLYPLMFATLGWWGIVPVVGLTALVSWRIDAWGSGTGALLNLLASTGLAVMIALFVTAIAKQSEQRRDALAALAATRAELAETSRHAGALGERERLAREIHDTVAQGLTSVVMHLEAADQAFDERTADARRHLEQARSTARDSLAEVRRSVHALRPELLRGVSLAEALERAGRRWSAETGILARFHVTGSRVPLHPNTETALLRTVQEALANVAKHASATRVTVTLSYLGETVTLDVDDDGVGFAGSPLVREDGGFGLTVMRERIAAVGGRLEVESAPGQGTTVAASVPV